MGQINKGRIAGIEGNTARIVPADAGARPTAKITIPWHLRGIAGGLKKDTEVVYVEFDDATGLLLGRADGEWCAALDELKINTLNAGTIIALSGTGENVNLGEHVHSVSGEGQTGKPI